MKVRGEIISAESTGDGVRLKLQARFAKQAKWMGFHEVSLVIPSGRAASYPVGRVIELTIGSKRER